MIKYQNLGSTYQGTVGQNLEAKERKGELPKFDKNILTKEVEVGMQHVEKTQTLGKEVDKLNFHKFVCEKCMMLQKSKYIMMNDSLPL